MKTMFLNQQCFYCLTFTWRGFISPLKEECFLSSRVRLNEVIRTRSVSLLCHGKICIHYRWIWYMCCGLANFLIKVYDSAADSPCYLSSMPLTTLNEREKLPQRENSGHFDVTFSVSNDGKGQWCTSNWFLWLQPQIVHKYAVINVVCSLCDNTKSKRIYEVVYLFLKQWKQVCCCWRSALCLFWLLDGHMAPIQSCKGA